MTKNWLTSNDIVKRLNAAVKQAGGPVAWTRAAGVFAIRGNVANMLSGKIKVSDQVLTPLGYQRVRLELYLPIGEDLPDDLRPFVHQPAPGAGRQSVETPEEESVLGKARYQDLDLDKPADLAVYLTRVAEEFERLSFAALTRAAARAMGREEAEFPNRHLAIRTIASARIAKLKARTDA